MVSDFAAWVLERDRAFVEGGRLLMGGYDLIDAIAVYEASTNGVLCPIYA